MAKKIMPGVMAALIALLSLIGWTGTSFAATGGPSLSKYWYAEEGELPNGIKQSNSPVTDAEMWKLIDTFMSTRMRQTEYDYYHIFLRTTNYDDKGNKIWARDYHQFVVIAASENAKPSRVGGRLVFLDALGQKHAYDILSKGDSAWSTDLRWMSFAVDEGLVIQDTSDLKTITVFEKLGANTIYDPSNPPAYGMPGMTDPMEAGSGGVSPSDPSNPSDPDFPVQPTPPDSNWDLIGWIKYIVDWIIYIVKCFVYFLKSFGSAIGDVVTGSSSLISAMSDFFAFLPNQVTTIIGMGIVAMIIVGVVKR